MIVVITAETETDLERIGDAIAQHNPARAITFGTTAEVRDTRTRAAAVCADPPLRAHQHPSRCHGNYLIFYRVSAELVEVVHILHGAMNYSAILPDE
jgi:toxin ParE1/3/4